MSLKSQIPSLIFFFQETGNRAEHVVKIKLESLAILQKNSYDEDPVYANTLQINLIFDKLVN